jgi:2-dehydropantoate 2-reductase
MLTDVRHGRAMETEAILGNAVRIAKEKGVEVKGLSLLYTLLQARDFSMNPDQRWKNIFTFSDK